MTPADLDAAHNHLRDLRITDLLLSAGVTAAADTIEALLGELIRVEALRAELGAEIDRRDEQLGVVAQALVDAEGTAQDHAMRARAERARADSAEVENAGLRARVDQLEAQLTEQTGALAQVEEELAAARYQLTDSGWHVTRTEDQL
jgi:chromosome segregation ATPase